MTVERYTSANEDDASRAGNDFPRDAQAAISWIPSEENLTKLQRCLQLLREQAFSPGEYEVIYDQLPVNEELSRSSHEVKKLPEGTHIRVVEVDKVDGRIRGRIETPSGWISLGTSDGEPFAKAVKQEGLREQPERAGTRVARCIDRLLQELESGVGTDAERAELPTGWRERNDAVGKEGTTYYFNDNTGEARWERPQDPRSGSGSSPTQM